MASSFPRFLVEVGLFLSLQLVGFAYAFTMFDEANDQTLMAALVDKERAARARQAPGLLLAGGSSVAFGVDSDRLEEELGRPVVNLGVQAGLGQRFLLDHALDLARPGDVLIVSFEYELFLDTSPNGRELLRLLAISPRHVAHMSWLEWKTALDEAHLTAFSIVRTARGVALHGLGAVIETFGVYRRDGFDAHGDLIAHLGRSPPGELSGEREALVISEGSLRTQLGVMKEAVARAQSKGATVAFSFPPYPTDLMERDRAVLVELEAHLRRVPGLIVLDSPDATAMAREYFFDTVYHLAESGMILRTRHLARALEEAGIAPAAPTDRVPSSGSAVVIP